MIYNAVETIKGLFHEKTTRILAFSDWPGKNYKISKNLYNNDNLRKQS